MITLSDDDRLETSAINPRASQFAGPSRAEKDARAASTTLEDDPAVRAAMQQLEHARRAAERRVSEQQALEDEERELQQRLDRIKRKKASVLH